MCCLKVIRRQTDRQPERQTTGETDKHIDRKTDRQPERQTGNNTLTSWVLKAAPLAGKLRTF